MSIRRFSSRTQRLDASFLLEHLKGARSYRRIAGYFTSSLFEVAHELLEGIPHVRIVCNVDIHPDDLKVAQLAAALTGQAVADRHAQRLALDTGLELAAAAGGKAVAHVQSGFKPESL